MWIYPPGGDISGPRYPQSILAISQRAQDKENVAGYCAYEGSDAWWGPGGFYAFLDGDTIHDYPMCG